MDNTILLNDRYQLGEQLSRKPGRRTFLAEDLASKNVVIIKILLFDQDFQWDDLKLFEREAKTLQNITHPAIPKYLDYFEINDNNYKGFALVQTYIDAVSLDKLIQQGRKFSEAELVELANRLLDILQYLHRQNPIVIHRDIKPSNILLTNRYANSIGDIYLVDFGSVQNVTSKEGGTITIVGSYGYIPLEQFGGQAVPASDLYSLGMTIIYLITGIHPAELTQVNGQIQFKNNLLSKGFQRWLNKMIQPHLDRRFTDAKIAQRELKFRNSNISNYQELKPKYTNVELQYDGDQLEIIFPHLSKSIFIYIIKLLWKTVCSNLFLMMFFGIFIFEILSDIGLTSVVFVGLFSFVFFLILLWHYRIDEETYVKIIINRYKIEAYNRWGFKILTNYRSEISLLGYSPSYEFDKYLDSTGEVENRGKVKTNPELFIYAGSNKYSIANLTAAEFWWIGQELSEFLDLELHIIYPTPKVPPEPSSCGGCGC
jgi:serine/threonine protein kinase